MNLWSKIITALRGGASEAGEAIVDAQALRILDQEIRDADEELKQARDRLAEMMARQKVAEQKCTTLKSKIVEFEDYAIQALEKNNESLAQELAEKIAVLENQLNSEQSLHDEFKNSTESLRDATKQADNNIKQLKHQVDIVRATEDVQRAQEAVAQRHSRSHSRLTTAKDSLERIKEKQKLKSAQLNAAEELVEDASDDTLQKKLEEAGIVPGGLNADAVLLRLKRKVTPRIGNDKSVNE
jgi:phage shock protein A